MGSGVDIEGMIREMMRDTQQFSISDLLQNVIYFFNQPEIRDYVIHHYLKFIPNEKRVDWEGTYYFDEKGMIDSHYHTGMENVHLKDFIKSKTIFKREPKTRHDYIIFTACILYEGNRVHFLSFIYDKTKKILVCFDPGVHLYHKGQEALIPLLQESFVHNGLISPKKESIERIGLCGNEYYGKKYGIQYEGSDPEKTNLPADSFCQSWTLFFLIEFLRHQCSDRFVSTWCKIPPKYREGFIITYYFLPWLQQDPFIHKKFNHFYPHAKRLPQLLQHVIHMFPTHAHNTQSR